jgi:phenylalanyl-tRNA synthetase beta chain
MKVLLSWLKEFVDISISVEELAERMTLSGTSVEGLKKLGEGIENVVVGEVKEVKPHPQAANLLLCRVSVRNRRLLQIVCGAPNVQVGQKVPVALVSAKLPGGVEVVSREIRGVVSEGMICSELELGIGEDASGILVLDKNMKVGQDIKEALGLDDYLLEFEIMPNRPDCLGVIGIAREVAATLKTTLKKPELSLEEIGKPISEKVKIEILDSELCPRYSARLIEGVKITPSPFWMQKRLAVAGIRPISNVVDVTNYVMLETGQPLHAFDFEKIAEGTIVVRRAKQGEELVTLDGDLRQLDEEMLVIADPEKAVALAGVMGGAFSEVNEETKNILIESANFKATNIARTSRKLGLSSEASFRFERGVDVGGTVYAAERAAQLIKLTAGGTIYQDTLDAYPRPRLPRAIPLRVERVNELLGTNISVGEAEDILKRLDMEVALEDGQVEVLVPTWRVDVEREIDLVEEVARLYGYNEIPATLPASRGRLGGLNELQRAKQLTREVLTGCGLNEVICYSFFNPEELQVLKLKPDDPWLKTVDIANPMSLDQKSLRPTLIPGLLNVLKRNVYRGNPDLAVFEIGKVFQPQPGQAPLEREKLGLVLHGNWRRKEWFAKEEKINFFDGKGIIETLFERLGIKDWQMKPAEKPFLQPGDSISVLMRETDIGFLGELRVDIQSQLDLPFSVILAELDLEMLLEKIDLTRWYQEIPKYPSIVYDVALIVDEEVSCQSIEEAIKEVGGEFLKGVRLFDTYTGKKIPSGQRSLAFSLTFQSHERTLTEVEVKKDFENIISHLQKKFKAQVRSQI